MSRSRRRHRPVAFSVAKFLLFSGRNMKTMILRFLLAAFAAAGLPASALAVPLLWTLNGVTLSDGGTASGSFVYDATANTNSAVNIKTTSGSSVTGSTYTFVCSSPCDGGLAFSPTYLVALTVSGSGNLTGLPVLELRFNTSLTNAGGTVTLNTISFEDRCSDSNCIATTTPFRSITAGSITAGPLAPAVSAQIPTLSTWALIVLALLVVGSVAFGRRRPSGH
jgi:IPTL-CTERM motif